MPYFPLTQIPSGLVHTAFSLLRLEYGSYYRHIKNLFYLVFSRGLGGSKLVEVLHIGYLILTVSCSDSWPLFVTVTLVIQTIMVIFLYLKGINIFHIIKTKYISSLKNCQHFISI